MRAILIAWLLFLYSGPVQADALRDLELANQVKAIFQRSCYGCHGQPGTAPKAGLNILNYDQLVGDGLVIGGASEFSQLFEYVESGEMPPLGDKFPDGTTPPSVSKEEVETIRKWIDDGADEWEDDGSNQVFISYVTIIELIEKEIKSLDSITAGRTRFVSLAHLKNRGLPDEEIQFYRQAMIKLFNSLSGHQELYNPDFIDADRLIFRIDLQKLNWFPRSWSRLEREYPFSDPSPSSLEKTITRKLVTKNAFLRGDWFSATASRPPLYHEILYVDALNLSGGVKDVLGELEETLGVDRVENILSGKAVRGGFNSSGVSVNNRIIERHDIGFYKGAYWLSYDFAGNSAEPDLRQNIFSFPLGPIEAFPESDETFLHAGGEVIFSLPNGLHGYLLTDEKGNRLDKAPTNIVTDPARPDNAVENGASCFRCHDKGMILKRDTIRDFIDFNQDLYADNFVVLQETYQGNQVFYELQKRDLNNYLKQVQKIGISPKKQEPVSRGLVEFERDLDISVVASELYLKEKELLAKIEKSNVLKSIIGPAAVTGGRIKRDYFIENFQTLFEEIK